MRALDRVQFCDRASFDRARGLRRAQPAAQPASFAEIFLDRRIARDRSRGKHVNITRARTIHGIEQIMAVADGSQTRILAGVNVTGVDLHLLEQYFQTAITVTRHEDGSVAQTVEEFLIG